VLGIVALTGLRPWATSSLAPNLSLSPGLGVALGDSTVVVRAGSPGVGTGGVAAPKAPAPVSAPGVVSVPKHRASSQPALAVSPGRPLGAAVPVPISSPPVAEPAPSPQTVAVTPAPAPELAAAPPVVAAVQNGGQGTSGGPITSGVGGHEPQQSCEGDEYLITVTFEEAEVEEAGYGQAEADIVVQRLGVDGSETEVQLRGDLTDVRDLVATLVAEGNCVQVDVQPLPETDPAEDASESGDDVVEFGDVVESALP
jgi:hypothetical protein